MSEDKVLEEIGKHAEFADFTDSTKTDLRESVRELARIAREEHERASDGWAAQINFEESQECSAELFALVCAVLDNKPEAADARAQLERHVEHVRACQRGSCESELHGAKALRERAEKAEGERDKFSGVATEQAIQLTGLKTENARLREALMRAGWTLEEIAAELRGGKNP